MPLSGTAQRPRFKAIYGVGGKNGVSFHFAFTAALLQLFGSWIHLCRTYHNMIITNSRSREWQLINNRSMHRSPTWSFWSSSSSASDGRRQSRTKTTSQPPRRRTTSFAKSLNGESERTCLIWLTPCQTYDLTPTRTCRYFRQFCTMRRAQTYPRVFHSPGTIINLVRSYWFSLFGFAKPFLFWRGCLRKRDQSCSETPCFLQHCPWARSIPCVLW